MFSLQNTTSGARCRFMTSTASVCHLPLFLSPLTSYQTKPCRNAYVPFELSEHNCPIKCFCFHVVVPFQSCTSSIFHINENACHFHCYLIYQCVFSCKIRRSGEETVTSSGHMLVCSTLCSPFLGFVHLLLHCFKDASNHPEYETCL